MTYCGDPDAFYGWPRETQERVLGWYRMRHTPKAPPKRGRGMQARPGDTITSSGASFWGLNGG